MNWERLLRGELSLTIDILIGFAVGVLVIHTGLADRLLSRLLPWLKRFGIGATLGAALTVSVGSSKAGAAVVASALDSGRISPRTAKWGTLLLAFPAYLRRWVTTMILACSLARLAGASVVILSEPVAMRREIGLQLGADLVVDPMTENPKAFVERHLGVPGVDVVIECVGNPAASRQALELTKRGTTVLLFSVPKAGTSVDLSLEDVYQKELRIIGSLINPDTHGRAAALINSGRIRLGPILTHRYPLNQVREAIFMQQSNESLKVLIKPELPF